MQKEPNVYITPQEVALLIKMSSIPLKIMSQLPEGTVAKAMVSLVEKGLLTPDDIPSPEEMKAFDELAKRLGIPSSDALLN